VEVYLEVLTQHLPVCSEECYVKPQLGYPISSQTKTHHYSFIFSPTFSVESNFFSSKTH
jgi:hypothetical protein